VGLYPQQGTGEYTLQEYNRRIWRIKTTQIYAEVTRTKIDEDMTNLAKTIKGKYDLSDAPTKKRIRKVVFANE
jgi:hypothetical protein